MGVVYRTARPCQRAAHGGRRYGGEATGEPRPVSPCAHDSAFPCCSSRLIGPVRTCCRTLAWIASSRANRVHAVTKALTARTVQAATLSSQARPDSTDRQQGSGSDSSNEWLRDPREGLTPTARRIVDAAQQLLIEEGYAGVSFDKVALRAGANKTSIRYNFGNKDGLIAVVVDTIMYLDIKHGHEIELASRVDDPLQAAAEHDREIILGTDAFIGFYSVLPYAVRDANLRSRIAHLYPQWYERHLRQLELLPPEGEEASQLHQDLGRLLTAVLDGLAVQYLLDPDAWDPQGPLELLRFLLAGRATEISRMLDSAPPKTAGS